MPESVIAGDQMGVQSSGVSLVSTVDCALRQSKTGSYVQADRRKYLHGPYRSLAHQGGRISCWDRDSRYSQESSQRLWAPARHWEPQPPPPAPPPPLAPNAKGWGGDPMLGQIQGPWKEVQSHWTPRVRSRSSGLLGKADLLDMLVWGKVFMTPLRGC